jgi:hypothetical protein
MNATSREYRKPKIRKKIVVHAKSVMHKNNEMCEGIAASNFT